MDPFIWPATLFGQKAGIATKKQQHIYISFSQISCTAPLLQPRPLA